MPGNDGSQTIGALNDVFRRVVDKPKPKPAATGPKPVAPTGYTQDVIARGVQAVHDRATAATYDRAQAPAGLDWAVQSNHGAPSNDAYQLWLANRGFTQQYPVTFGQTKKGKYSGFATEGELKAAVLGTADQARMADKAQAHAMQQAAQRQLDQVTSQYQTQHDQAAGDYLHTVTPLASSGLGKLPAPGRPAQIPLNISHDMGTGDTTVRPPVDPSGDGIASVLLHPSKWADALKPDQQAPVQAPAPDQATLDQQQYAGQLHDYLGQMDQWLASQSEPALGQMETAQQIAQTPLRDYASLGGAKYGVDPALVAGWYPESSDVADYNAQQNVSSIGDYGVPYTQLVQWQNEQEQQAAAADRQATTDQAAQEKQATQASTDQAQQAVADATGLDANQLAQSVNMTPAQVASVVSDPNYQMASQDLSDVLGITDNPDYADLSDADRQTQLQAVIDQVKRDPQMYAILRSVYGEYATF